jgi:hypothetical protein
MRSRAWKSAPAWARRADRRRERRRNAQRPDGKPSSCPIRPAEFSAASRRDSDRRALFGQADLFDPAPRKTIDIDGNETEISTKGRHDPCVGIRAVPIAEAMMACVLRDHALRHRAQMG